MRRLLALLLVVAPACIVARGSLEVNREGLDPELAESIRRVEVFVLAGTTRDGAEVNCSNLLEGVLAPDDPSLTVHYGASFDVLGGVPPAVGHLPEGRAVFFARASDGACAVVARGCTDPEIVSGREASVTVSLEAMSPVPCPTDRACVAGECRACQVDGECDDHDPCTVDDCDDGVCVGRATFPDVDQDGFGDAACGGEDCDDADRAVFPDAPRRCGRGVDHDCNGIVDDAEGCGTCAGATGLVLRAGASIATPAVGVSSLGPSPDGPADQELFVGTPSRIEVHSLPAGGAPTLVATSPFPGVTPSSPVVVGDHLLVADVEGGGAIMLFSLEDLRAGDATPLDVVGESLGVLSAFAADSRNMYVNVGSGAGALAVASTTSLPDLAEPDVVLASGEWGNCRALARDGGVAGGWLVGALGQAATWAQLGSRGEVLASGNATVREGFGSDIALSAGRVLLAQGDRGLMVIDFERFTTPGCCLLADMTNLAVPVGCTGTACRNGVAVAVASEDRAVLMGFQNSGDQRVVLYLIDTTDVAAMTVVDSAPLSHPMATGRDLFVSGGVVFAAGRVGTTSEGVLDVFDLVCE